MGALQGQLWPIGCQKYQVYLKTNISTKLYFSEYLRNFRKKNPPLILTFLNKGWRVLLLEAGPDESEASDIPVLANSMQGGLFDWQYKVGKLKPNNQTIQFLASQDAPEVIRVTYELT